ncbi:fimbrial biogenesis chaperone [Serratia fonticola]|uniref:fimbrial biogenesis chaperone n=1 Tax=Serratia fonticola TaxID=47917 RepID=UPI0016454C35|nr:molecular chaperone [Serratia fonticola]MBC3219663.1 molecular chaperone [Serratia fonticola]
MRLSFSAVVLGTLLVLPAFFAQAQQGGISLNQTRVIFAATDKAQTITVNNSDSRSWLIQSRMEAGTEGVEPPFIVTPPLLNLNGQSSQLLRILPKDHALPTDRESLFYLSVTAIPSQAGPLPEEGRLSLGLRFVLKLFYRPAGLAISPVEAACHLRLSSDVQGLRITNPTPYFQTLGALSLDGRAVDIEPQQSMVAPQSSLTLARQSQAQRASWQTVTDHGGLSAPCNQTL